MCLSYLYRCVLFADIPDTPTPGTIEFWIDKTILFGAVVSFLILLSLVLNESSRAIWFARGLASRDDWPDAVLVRFKPTPWLDHAESPIIRNAIDHWLDVEVISRVTDPIQRIIFYPFVVIAILITARCPLFDAWNMPGFLIVLFSLCITMLVSVAVILRRTAEDLRRRASLTITQGLLHAKTLGEREKAEQLQALLDYLKDLRRGAFAHFSRQPLAHALLTVIGSYSGIALLEYVRISGL